jgi:hypothetical protein
LIPAPFSGFFRLPAVVELWNHPALYRDYQWDPELEGFRRRAPQERAAL